MTLVESIHQLIKRDPDIRILACAPSNSAADLIAQKLVALGPSRLFRLNSLSRKTKDIPLELRDFVLINEHGVFEIPEKERLEKYNIIVSTCITGGVPGLLGLGIRPGHFEYIFIDEAGQAKEPEALIPIMCNASQRTKVVLAGDNQQLGPICSSNLASALGLKMSYLSRLMELPLYDLHGPQPPRT
jgi:helicase MOV-10